MSGRMLDAGRLEIGHIDRLHPGEKRAGDRLTLLVSVEIAGVFDDLLTGNIRAVKGLPGVTLGVPEVTDAHA
jgi:hypothetical protein